MPEHSSKDMESRESPTVHLEEVEPGTFMIQIDGRLDSMSVGEIWPGVMASLDQRSPTHIIFGASNIDYCDVSGIALILEIHRHQMKRGGTFEIRGLKDEFRQLLNLFKPTEFENEQVRIVEPVRILEKVGRITVGFLEDTKSLIRFLGELSVALFHAALKPRQIRWQDAYITAESAGVDALPIIALISFLMGLIMAFQSAIPMRQFGAEIYVADLIGLSMLRELGPLMTAIILAGRSGSAFGAEIGTMRVNEEIDALTTMGLDPVRFLVVPRVIAALVMTPMLTVFADLVGVMGGSIVLLSLGYSLITYFNQVLSATTYIDFLGGLLKSFVFGVMVASIGCFRGLQTKTGATAVGEAATQAVVSGIILIVIMDGIFSVIYFYLGI